jgi:hypothetical protein
MRRSRYLRVAGVSPLGAKGLGVSDDAIATTGLISKVLLLVVIVIV